MLDIQTKGLQLDHVDRITVFVVYTEPNLILPFLDDLALSHKSATCRISSGHRIGKLAQTSKFGKHNEIDLTMAASVCIFMGSPNPHISF